jgi:hypothetical protein
MCSSNLLWTLRLSAAALLLVSITSAALAAQTPTLADLAKKEQTRRQGLKVPTKVYTKDDLPPTAIVPPALPAATPAAAAPAPAAAGEEKKPDAPKEEKGEEWWRQTMAHVREELRRNEMFAEALQSRMNAMAVDVANRDDPGQRQKLSEERQKAVQEFGRVQADVVQLKKQIVDLEEEARQAGVPPGWIR